MESGCLHLSVSDEGICVDCGVDINSPEYLASLPPVSDKELGDIVNIIRLAEATAVAFTELVAINTDPNNPALPRLRLVGGQLLRLPHETLWAPLLKPSFQEAKQLGYRGTYQRWGEIVKDFYEKTGEKGGQSRIL